MAYAAKFGKKRKKQSADDAWAGEEPAAVAAPALGERSRSRSRSRDRGRRRRSRRERADEEGGRKPPPPPWLADGRPASLDAEVRRFAAWARPTHDERRARRLVVKRVEDAARAVWPRATCSVYGSSDTESTWFLSDLDLRVAPNEAMTFLSPSYAVEELAEALRERSALFGRVESRPRARVPIVVLQDRATRVSCDVSFADDGGPPVAAAPAHADHGDLMVFLKALLRDRDLAAPCAAPFTGGLGSFRTSLLLATYLGRPDPDVGLLRGFLERTAGRRGGGLTANLSIRGVGYGGVDVGRVRRALSDALGSESLAGMLLDVDGLVALREDSSRRAAEACRSAPRGAAIPPPTCYAPLEPAEPDLFGRD
ncbi:unnamed protein product [Pelagomonas calceolata]|uniref:Poly(A) RNA polymerase mitochondrial-like central palm domain-containing protein n=1 Tax=Pelagomonas calceolata TaxID=35677 RepID=A0A8J2SLF3_9STRA|nr:unnamed protein product [Pelagomonas calceolata]